jgi:Rieske Fe-S protein
MTHEPTHSGEPPVIAPDAQPDRRGVLKLLSIVFGALAALAAGIPIIGYLLGPMTRLLRDRWVDLGPVEGFPLHQTRLVDFENPLRRPWDGVSGRSAAYVRRTGVSEFKVFAINCTHLGCPVSWFPQSGLFMCPCHGGIYYEDGARASGPPPRGLYQYAARIENGRLQILTGHMPTLNDPPTAPPEAKA